MLSRRTKKSKGGFTLIEIIAVLIILGILAAVAVPKFLDLQEQALSKSLRGAIAAAQSQAAMDYSRLILSYGSEASAWTLLNVTEACNVANEGYPSDFTLTCTGGGSGSDTITITANASNSSEIGNFTRPTN